MIGDLVLACGSGSEYGRLGTPMPFWKVSLIMLGILTVLLGVKLLWFLMFGLEV